MYFFGIIVVDWIAQHIVDVS